MQFEGISPADSDGHPKIVHVSNNQLANEFLEHCLHESMFDVSSAAGHQRALLIRL